MNEAAIIDTLARIRDEQALIDAGKQGVGLNMHVWYAKSACGTTACLAGHAAIGAGYEALAGSDMCRHPESGAVFEFEELGAELLGITAMEANSLFYLNDLDEVYSWLARNMGIDEQVLRDKVAHHEVTY